jgi:hypothetical protein
VKKCRFEKTKKSNLLAFLHLLVLTQFICNYNCTILQLPTIVTNQNQIGLLFWIFYIKNHRCTQVGSNGGMKEDPPAIFWKLAHKNAIKKTKMVYPLEIFLKKPWFPTPPQGFWHKFELPPPLDFQPCAPNKATYIRNNCKL